MDTSGLTELFLSDTGERPGEIVALSAAGSNRQYFRMKSMHYIRIGVNGTSVEENRAFVYMSEYFIRQGLPVPRVYALSDDGMCYLQEDLGDCLLFDGLAAARRSGCFGAAEYSLLHKTITLLPDIQFKGVKELDFNRCYPLPEFNRRSVFWDLNYFKYCFLKPTGIDFQEDDLENDFNLLADVVLAEIPEAFMYRDFQSRNVMIRDGNPYFIDFQGGRKGPFYYDVASFLWQAKAMYPQELRRKLAEEYRLALQKYVVVGEQEFYARLKHFVLFRMLQVLGAYGFRGYFEKKAHFIESVPPAIANLKELLREGFPEYPYLSVLLLKMTELECFAERKKEDVLTVHVYSFSYKKGIPEDRSGNGGGFVFDCRAIHNPGRYEQYRQSTGLDESVIRFLEEDGEISVFLKHVYALVDTSVQRYLERGFTSLTVCFGCTGGRHRSVYAAQHLAEHLYKTYAVRVHLIHREQNIETYWGNV